MEIFLVEHPFLKKGVKGIAETGKKKLGSPFYPTVLMYAYDFFADIAYA